MLRVPTGLATSFPMLSTWSADQCSTPLPSSTPSQSWTRSLQHNLQLSCQTLPRQPATLRVAATDNQVMEETDLGRGEKPNSMLVIRLRSFRRSLSRPPPHSVGDDSLRKRKLTESDGSLLQTTWPPSRMAPYPQVWSSRSSVRVCSARSNSVASRTT